MAAWRGRFSVGRAGVVGGPGVLRRGMCYGARDDVPDLAEVEAALRAVRWWKAAGPDWVGMEMLRVGGKWVSVWLVKLFGLVWETGNVPVEWKRGLIVRVPDDGVVPRAGGCPAGIRGVPGVLCVDGLVVGARS